MCIFVYTFCMQPMHWTLPYFRQSDSGFHCVFYDNKTVTMPILVVLVTLAYLLYVLKTHTKSMIPNTKPMVP